MRWIRGTRLYFYGRKWKITKNIFKIFGEHGIIFAKAKQVKRKTKRGNTFLVSGTLFFRIALRATRAKKIGDFLGFAVIFAKQTLLQKLRKEEDYE